MKLRKGKRTLLALIFIFVGGYFIFRYIELAWNPKP